MFFLFIIFNISRKEFSWHYSFSFSLAKFQKYFQSLDWFQVSYQAAVLLTDISLVNSWNFFQTCLLCERHNCFFLSKTKCGQGSGLVSVRKEQNSGLSSPQSAQ